MKCKLLVGIAVMGLIALNGFAVVDTVTGSRTLAKFVKTMQDEDAVIITSSAVNGGTIKNVQIATNAAIVASKLSGVTTNVTKQTGAITASGTVTPAVMTNGTIAVTVVPVLSTNTLICLDGSSNIITNIIVYVSGVSATAILTPETVSSAAVAVSVVGGGAVVTNVAVQNTP